MTREGWIIMICSISGVLLLVSFCLYRVLTLPRSEVEHLHGPVDIDTGDKVEPD